jgi:hypothetical protein
MENSGKAIFPNNAGRITHTTRTKGPLRRIYLTNVKEMWWNLFWKKESVLTVIAIVERIAW